MDLVSLKLLFAGLILAAGWLGGLLPIVRRESRGRMMRYGNAFAAGVLLGIGLIHMLADADERWREIGSSYPVAYLLAGVAFIVFLLIEHVLLPEPAHAMVHHGHHHPHSHPHSGDHEPADGNQLYPWALVAALSIHSFVVGIALGSQSLAPEATVIFAAIMAHKSTAGFALGISLVRSPIETGVSRWLVALFSLATPVGIVIALVLRRGFDGPTLAYFDAIFLALAAGTFLYIASLDILNTELLHGGSRWGKWLSAAVGLALTAALSLWV